MGIRNIVLTLKACQSCTPSTLDLHLMQARLAPQQLGHEQQKERREVEEKESVEVKDKTIDVLATSPTEVVEVNPA